MIGYIFCIESSISVKSVFSEDVAYFGRLTVELAKKFPISCPPFCGCPSFLDEPQNLSTIHCFCCSSFLFLSPFLFYFILYNFLDMW